jgi:exosome complex component RRP42
MAETLMSEGERLFIVHSVEDDCRVDGRRCLESRKLRLESSIMANCHGSSRIRVGKTDLLVGVKAQIESPETTGKARIVFAADCSANASPAFEGRGGEDLASEIVSLLQKSFEPCLDLESLCLSPGKSVWVLTVDLLILEFGSKANLIDAAGIAVKAALFDTRLVASFSSMLLSIGSLTESPK